MSERSFCTGSLQDDRRHLSPPGMLGQPLRSEGSAWLPGTSCLSGASWLRGCLVFLVACLALSGSSGAAQAQEPNAADALERFPSVRWFDDETGSYQPPEVKEPRDNPIRTNGWRTLTKKSSWDWDWPNWNWNWLPSGAGSALAWLVYCLLAILVLTGLGVLIWFVVRDYVPSIRESSPQRKEIKIDLARVEALPFEAKLSMGDPLAAAQRLMESGDFDAAIVYLYGYMLLALDSRGHIFLQKGKTNRMYLRELRLSELSEIVQQCMLAFESSFFGKHPTTQAAFQAVWQRVEEFNRLASTAPSSAKPLSPELGMTV